LCWTGWRPSSCPTGCTRHTHATCPELYTAHTRNMP
jgi:hypothetical protein